MSGYEQSKGGQKSESTPQSSFEDGHAETKNPLRALFVEELTEIQSAEEQIAAAYPTMHAVARALELREMLESHLAETRVHVARIQRVAESIGVRLRPKVCKGMQGIIEEAGDVLARNHDDSGDVALVAAAQKAEHYEISSYTTLIAWAGRSGFTEAEILLKETLAEELAADEKLTWLGETLGRQLALKQKREEK